MTGAELRSLLFVPGDREELIHKALASAADAVIIDLEDAVAPDRKAEARRVTRAVLDDAGRGGKALFVRLNALDTALTATDAAAILGGRPWGVMLPKALGPADVARLSNILEGLEAREGVAAGTTRILTVSTETAAATLSLSAPDGLELQRLWGMLWGGEDLSATLGALSNRDDEGRYTFPYQFARSQCLYAANTLSVTPVDAVYTDFRDPDGLEAEARAALRDGFTAKAAIHPGQVEVINRVFTPGDEQLDWARRVIEVLSDRGVARLDGRMVDIAHQRIARRLLSRAESLRGRDCR